MNLVRMIIAGAVALAVTFGLFVLMHTLIAANMKEPEEGTETKIADIHMPERKIETKFDTEKPEKPEDPEEPPPEAPEPEFDTPDIDPGAVQIGAPKVDANLQVAGVGGFSSDGEYLPIVKVQPVYPRRALSRGIEGFVIVEFTVTKSGAVRDPVVVQAEPPNIFNKAAVKAALKFKYKPRVIDGEPIEVPGVQNKITFAIAK